MVITNDIKYVGVNDRKIDLFEGQYIVPNGISYNSYVILDSKVAVMDTVDAAFIARDVLGMEVDDIYFYKEDYAGILVKLGWIKLTNTLLFDYYKEAGLYNKMTNEQSDSFEKWYTYHFEHREI